MEIAEEVHYSSNKPKTKIKDIDTLSLVAFADGCLQSNKRGS